MWKYLAVGIGGSLGAMARYAVGEWLYRPNITFPVATLTVNLIGSFALAFFTTFVAKRLNVPSWVHGAIATGFIGSFTTFSTLSVETIELIQDHRIGMATLYILLSVVGGLWFSRLGFVAAKEEGA